MKKPVLFALFVSGVIVLLVLLSSSSSFFTFDSRDLNNLEPKIWKATTDNYSKPRTILIYTEFFSSGLPWPGLETSEDFTQFKGKKCRITNCELTYNKEKFSKSNVVIFHAYNMPSSEEMSRLQQKRPQCQVWVYFHLENPIVTSYIAPHKDRIDLDNVFNWTMTFMRESDIFHPYGFYLPLEKREHDSRLRQNHATGKNKLAVWTGSGCGQVLDERKVRVLYIHNLRKHMPIDIYGDCAKHFHQPNLKVQDCPNSDGRPTTECASLLQKYKFILAFENMNCIDYITEKYWCTPLELGIVPVVMGGADYKALAIPGSYINVFDFSSLKELADYLLYLDQNDDEYNKYFEWKKRYKVGGCLRGHNMANHYPWMCEICAAANNGSIVNRPKFYEKIQDFYDPEKRCGIQYSRLKEIISEAFDNSFKRDIIIIRSRFNTGSWRDKFKVNKGN